MSQTTCIDACYRSIEELKLIVTNFKKSKKIFEPIIRSSSETIRALRYVKPEIETYFRQYKDAFNKYKITLENIKKFADEIKSKENSIFYPYKQVKEKYDKLLKEYEDCEMKIHPILIKVIMNKQECQQETFKKIHEILQTIPDDNKKEQIVEIENMVQGLTERSGSEKTGSDIYIPRGRRETQEIPTLDSLGVQRKYSRIITEGWENNPEKRIRMEEILWRFSDIEGELTKLKKNNLGSGRSTVRFLNPNGRNTKSATRAVSNPDKPNFTIDAEFLKKRRQSAFEPSKKVVSLSPPPTPSTPGFLITSSDDDTSNSIKTDDTIETLSETSCSIKSDDTIETLIETSNSIRTDDTIETLSETSCSIKTDDTIETLNEISNSMTNFDEMITNLTMPEEFKDIVSNQKDNGSFEVSETICKEMNVPIIEIIPTLKKFTQNNKLQYSESDSWWKTALTLSYLKVAALLHEIQWKDNCNKALEYLSKQIGDAAVEKELLDCTDKYVADSLASLEKCTEITSKQEEDGSIESDVHKGNIINKIKKNITIKNLQLPEFLLSLAPAAIHHSSQHQCEWRDKYNKLIEEPQDESLVKHCEITHADKESDQNIKVVNYDL
ncbi:9974_t:CDS:2, partial [Dentiscutata erythropus]